MDFVDYVGWMYEGGTRVPFIATWPARIKPKASDALIGQMDLVSSLAALTGRRLAADAAPDSFNVLPALLGDSPQGRDHLVEYANGLAIRRGQWKLIPGKGPEGKAGKKNARLAEPELYNLAADPAEAKNVAAERQDVAKDLTALLERVRSSGQSRPKT